MKHFVLTCMLLIFFMYSKAQPSISGNLKFWNIEDFLGFDPVGDLQTETGDITSVYLKKQNGRFLLRISFDDLVERKSDVIIQNKFENKKIVVELTIGERLTDQTLYSESVLLSGNSGFVDGNKYLVTPENNLIEFEFNTPVLQSGDHDLYIAVKVDDKTADTFTGNTKGTLDMGNCAFVHHGNQGLTHTDVFYGNPNGQSGIDGSGYDEVLNAHRATGIPGNFHMSGTLMPAAEWHNPEFNDTLAAMASRGLVSMMTSALGQNIMPFSTDEMNNWSVYTESQMVKHFYNYNPRVAWVPERVWLANGYYPDNGIVDWWLGDNWVQNGSTTENPVLGVVLDDSPHLNIYNNHKIHWMNNGSGIDLRVIPIDNTFVGDMQSNADNAKNHIASMGQYEICVYGTDWEVAAEMNEHDGTNYLENYWSVLWYCHDNYPGVNVWKLENAIENPDFNGESANITTGTYGLLGGFDGYGGSNNSWYIDWASTPSHSDYHTPKWNYGTVWTNAFNFLMSVNNNNLAQLGWYTLMINLHETGWHTSGSIADWEHRYSSHIKNANVYTEASLWADGQYATTTACYFDDIDRDGVDELVMHNDKVFMVFESIGGKANWVFYKNGFGDAFSVVSSDMAYWAETDGDYNESSNNHVAALSDVSPNQQNSIYNISIIKANGDTVIAELDQWGVQKTLKLYTGVDYMDVAYDFFEQTGYVKSGWSPDLLDLIWSGKSHLQRMWGNYGSYCGYRNSSSGATAALILGNGGASHNLEFEGTLVKGDEIKGYNKFEARLFAGYTSPPSGTSVPELDNLASQNMDIFPPVLYSPAALFSANEVILSFSEAVDQASAENTVNYNLQNFTGSYVLLSAERQANWNLVKLTFDSNLQTGDQGQIVVNNIEDLSGNVIDPGSSADLTVPTGITPHTITIDGFNDFTPSSELIDSQIHDLYITWDNTNLYVGFYSMDLGSEGDLFVSIDTDQTPGSGATTDAWLRADYADPYKPEFEVAVENGYYQELRFWDGSQWGFNSVIGSYYIGWSGNGGFTEMGIPWSALGNPQSLALSVHISAEDSDNVPEIFPSLNSTGTHPTIQYFYAFYSPYIPGNMPLSAFEPNQVYIVPNTPVQINSFLPTELSQQLQVNMSQSFSVSATDAENDPISFDWKLDGIVVGQPITFYMNPHNPI